MTSNVRHKDSDSVSVEVAAKATAHNVDMMDAGQV